MIELNDIELAANFKISKKAAQDILAMIRAKRVEILVSVVGGCVTYVHSSDSNVGVTLRDFDNINAGEVDPLDKFYDPVMQRTDYTGAGYPFEVY